MRSLIAVFRISLTLVSIDIIGALLLLLLQNL